MNRTALKNYAPQARRAFIQAVTDRAAYYGLSANKIEPVIQKGDVAVIGGRENPRAVVAKRRQLEERIKKHGFESTMEAIAYTWFNRLVAIRFMELHGYLEHGYRVLSHPEGKATPEILEQAEHVALAGLKRDVVVDLKLAGNREDELYRLLLTAQCNALHAAMPILFERIDDETELLLPSNLLNSDSLVRKLVGEIDEQDWQQVEIIGWLYQFYISEKKDEVIGKVVASEDIPAATQLFTPNWIVRYLVQNTLGRQWLATYPQSALRQQMEYYIEPAEQTFEVQQELKTITPTSLNPEELTLLDPACGSGHILVEAYDLFKAVYQERGYRAKDIPALILEKNLFGLEIDDRAAQLASFALMMKARADDRRIFDSEVKPNILAFQDSQGMDASDIVRALNSPIDKDDIPSEYLFEEIQEEKDGLFSKKALAEKGHVSQADIVSLLDLFQNAKTFGSLIQVPENSVAKLSQIERRLDDVLVHGDLRHASAGSIKPVLLQARYLTRQYDIVVANPPYMGNKGMTSNFKSFIRHSYPEASADVYAAFVERWLYSNNGVRALGFVCPYVWMFIASFEDFRRKLLQRSTITSLVQLEFNAFEPACVPVCSFVVLKDAMPGFCGDFVRLSDFKGHQNQAPRTLEAIQSKTCAWRFRASSQDFQHLPGAPIVYWASRRILEIFRKLPPLSSVIEAREGLTTADNERFLRYWHEVAVSNIGFDFPNNGDAVKSGMKWFPYVKGGRFRKWYGNNEYVVNWQNDGEEVRAITDPESGRIRSHNYNGEYGFRRGISWSGFSAGAISARYTPNGFMFDAKGPMAFATDDRTLFLVLGLLNSSIGLQLLQMLSPTADFKIGRLLSLPWTSELSANEPLEHLVRECVESAHSDSDQLETSWGFKASPLLEAKAPTSVAQSFRIWEIKQKDAISNMKRREEQLNTDLIAVYRLGSGFCAPVADEQISLYSPDREEDIKRLISYAIGCVMGRYCLDKAGLIYASSGNRGFDHSQYEAFRPKDDGILSLIEADWGIPNDGLNEIVEFTGVAWPKEHLEENLKFIADGLGAASNEQPRKTIRRYLATAFYKHHLSIYKRRPIYWHFSSGKQGAFQCLVYLHRYHEGTLARMRTEHVIPLQGQIAARIEQLEADKTKATSTSHRNKLQKEQTDLKKQQAELFIFEEKLKHLADQKITLDLDDGVKVNYAKFGDLLAESKAITGGKDDE